MSKGTKKKSLNEDSISPQAFPTAATSKAAMMANIINGIAAIPQPDLLPFFEKFQALLGQEASSIPDGTADKNLQSVNSANAAVNEELAAILESETLTEDFRDRASVLFESAVSTRVALVKAELEESNEAKLNEEIDRINETVLDQVDKYMTYVAEQWIKENKVAVNNSIRTELAESFIGGLSKLVNEHYFTIPDNQVDAVEALTEEIKSLQEKLNLQIDENISVKNQLDTFQKDEVLRQETSGLAATQVERIKELAEGVTFKDSAEFRKKVRILKESNFPSAPTKTTVLNEVVTDPVSTDVKPAGNSMQSLASLISKSVKK